MLKNRTQTRNLQDISMLTRFFFFGCHEQWDQRLEFANKGTLVYACCERVNQLPRSLNTSWINSQLQLTSDYRRLLLLLVWTNRCELYRANNNRNRVVITSSNCRCHVSGRRFVHNPFDQLITSEHIPIPKTSHKFFKAHMKVDEKILSYDFHLKFH
jgi:hypothetical protein